MLKVHFLFGFRISCCAASVGPAALRFTPQSKDGGGGNSPAAAPVHPVNSHAVAIHRAPVERPVLKVAYSDGKREVPIGQIQDGGAR